MEIVHEYKKLNEEWLKWFNAKPTTENFQKEREAQKTLDKFSKQIWESV